MLRLRERSFEGASIRVYISASGSAASGRCVAERRNRPSYSVILQFFRRIGISTVVSTRSDKRYDLIVIGSGPAGEKGTLTGALLGKRVALVEREPFVGGASVNTGTLPSKTLRETALALSGLRFRDLHGVDLSLRREATIRDLMYHAGHVKRSARERIWDSLQLDTVDVHRGDGSFVGPHEVRVTPRDGEPVLIEGDYILVATGSSPLRPPDFAFDDRRVHDSDEILRLDHLPKTMAVVGAGVIGSEYACTFAALGVEVHVIDGRDRLMPFLDSDISAALHQGMEELGITFHWSEQVTRCTVDHLEYVELECASGNEIRVDGVLVAAGRTGNTETLNLDAAGIATLPKGRIEVDECYRTSVKHIYAAGDVIGFPALAATSAEQARYAVAHAFGTANLSGILPLLPTGIYTIPELSMVGETEDSLRGKGIEYVVGRADYASNSRGEIIGDHNGFLKLLFRWSDMKLLGVHIIGEQATELIHAGMMVMLAGGGADIFDQACFNVPTLSDLYKLATSKALLARNGNREPVVTGTGS
jgi:NAD(P) transhydrogenase